MHCSLLWLTLYIRAGITPIYPFLGWWSMAVVRCACISKTRINLTIFLFKSKFLFKSVILLTYLAIIVTIIIIIFVSTFCYFFYMFCFLLLFLIFIVPQCQDIINLIASIVIFINFLISFSLLFFLFIIIIISFIVVIIIIIIILVMFFFFLLLVKYRYIYVCVFVYVQQIYIYETDFISRVTIYLQTIYCASFAQAHELSRSYCCDDNLYNTQVIKTC